MKYTRKYFSAEILVTGDCTVPFSYEKIIVINNITKCKQQHICYNVLTNTNAILTNTYVMLKNTYDTLINVILSNTYVILTNTCYTH